MRNLKRWTILFTAVLAVAPGMAVGCGACIEDKMAATYDHAIVAEAAATGRLVVFYEFALAGDPNNVTAQLLRAVPLVKGVQRGSVRVSAVPPAFSFVLDPHAQTPQAVTAELQRRVGNPALHIKLIRVMG